jgi:dolichol-phosphate mannosyltransferase
MRTEDAVGAPPPDRRAINAELTRELNTRLAGRLSAVDPGAGLTDAFCGFKAHRVEAMARLRLTENGYAFPMQLWVQAAAERLRIGEIPVRLIYNDPNRTFGGGLDDAQVRLNHYRCVMYREIERLADHLPPTALVDARARCPGA